MMIRNLKILGLAVATVFAFSAMTASGAIAQVQGKFTSANGQNFTLTGTEIAGPDNVLEGAFGVEVRCPGSTHTGHKVPTTPHQRLANGSTEATITPKYANCSDESGDPAVIHMNGCDFVIHDGTTVGSANTFAVKTNVVCPAGKVIEVTKPVCKITIGSQSGAPGFHLTNETGDMRLKGSIKLKATVCSFSVTVTQKLDVTIKADDSNEQAVNISMSD